MPVLGSSRVRVRRHQESTSRSARGNLRRIRVSLLHGRTGVVHDGHAQAVQVEFGGLGGAPVRDVRFVVVPEHGRHGRVLGQSSQDQGGADVTRVQDEIRPAQVLRHPRRAGPPAPRGVGIGQHYDSHESSHGRKPPGPCRGYCSGSSKRSTASLEHFRFYCELVRSPKRPFADHCASKENGGSDAHKRQKERFSRQLTWEA